jgi:hypothetical protein
MVEAGKAAFDPHGLIYDLSELSYEWGDALGDLFSIGPKYNFGDHPVAVVVGPHSEEAVRTLCLGLESKESIEAMGFVFRDLASAWAYVDSRIIKDTLVKELAKLKQRHGSGPTTEEAGSQEGQPRA